MSIVEVCGQCTRSVGSLLRWHSIFLPYFSARFYQIPLVYGRNATLPVDLNQSKDDSDDSDETSIADSDGSSVESISFEKHLETMIGIRKSALLSI